MLPLGNWFEISGASPLFFGVFGSLQCTGAFFNSRRDTASILMNALGLMQFPYLHLSLLSGKCCNRNICWGLEQQNGPPASALYLESAPTVVCPLVYLTASSLSPSLWMVFAPSNFHIKQMRNIERMSRFSSSLTPPPLPPFLSLVQSSKWRSR